MYSLFSLCVLFLVGLGESVLQRVLFSDAIVNQTGARCLDGTPAGYYIEVLSKTDVVIFLEGGGACYTNTGTSNVNCYVRAKSALGSSNYWSSTFVDTSNVLSDDPSVNPLFFNFTKVFVPYCGGDVHVGQRRSIVNASFPFYFSGHLTVMAVVEALINRTTVQEEAEVSAGAGGGFTMVLSGSSAGGIGTFLNADAVAAKFPPGKVTSFKALPQGGWFFPSVVSFPAWQGGEVGPPYAGESPQIDDLWAAYLPQACVAAHNRSYCGTITSSYPYFDTAMHIAENQEDTNQIFAQLGAPQTAAADSFISPYFQKAMQAALSAVGAAGAKEGDGLWAPACLAHTENLNLVANVTVGGKTYLQSLVQWYAEGKKTIDIDDCMGVQCNPTC